MDRTNTITLFDVDGTLTKPRNVVTEDIRQMLQQLKKKVCVGVVGGSDLSKIKEQLGQQIVDEYDYVFAENGLVSFHQGKQIAVGSIKNELGEEKLQSLINFILIYIAELKLPKKRGTFIEFRNGMINASPIGRNCDQEERNEFYKYDQEHKIREKMVEALQKQFRDFNLTFSIGGQISIDIFPVGWDKTYCLRYLKDFKNIYFFGDRTEKGGNDHEIFSSALVKGNTVTSPDNTKQLVHQIFLN